MIASASDRFPRDGRLTPAGTALLAIDRQGGLMQQIVITGGVPGAVADARTALAGLPSRRRNLPET